MRAEVRIVNEAERKARKKRHQQMDDREPPSDSRHVATESEEKWGEKEDDYGDEIGGLSRSVLKMGVGTAVS